MTAIAETPTLSRRLLCLVYDALLLIAIVLFAGGIATVIAQVVSSQHTHLITQAALVTLCPCYFAWHWLHGGQTLPMKTWRIRLDSVNAGGLSAARAFLRCALASIGYTCLGISVIWAVFDRDHQFLHDRLSGTRLVRTN